MNSSSSVALPCSRGSVRGLPSSRIFPCERNSTRSHTSSHLVHVVRGPEHAARAWVSEVADSRADLPRRRGIERGGGLVEQQQLRRFSMALARATRVCSPEDSTPHFVSRNLTRSNCVQQLLDAGRECLHAVDEAEDTQVLLHGQVAGQRRVDGGEVGALQRLGSGASRGPCPR